MKEFKKHAGIVGTVILFLSLIISMAKPEYGTYCWIGYGVGLALLIFFVIANFRLLREKLTGRTAKYGTYVSFHVAIVLCIIVFLNAITLRHTKQWDLTENKRFTLAEQTVSVLKNLKTDVSVLCFFTDNAPGGMQAENLMDLYKLHTSKLKVEFIDPIKKPGLAEQNQVTRDGTLVLTYEGKTERIIPPDSTSEEAITNALIKITRAGTKKIYFIKGHGEKDIADQNETGFSFVKQEVESINYEVNDLMLAQEEKIPDDCDILIIAGPETDYFDSEIQKLKNYIERPGNLLAMIDPGSFPKLDEFFKQYGIILTDTVIIDMLSRVLGAGYNMPIVSAYTEHPVAKHLTRYMTIFPVARAIQLGEGLPNNIKTEKICETNPRSWAETDLKALEEGNAQLDAGKDIQGPVIIAAAVTIESQPMPSAGDTGSEDEQNSRNAQILVFGDSDFAANVYLGQQKNADLFMNAVSFLAEEKDLIAIRPKTPNNNPVVLTKSQYDLVKIISYLVPFFILFVGITVYSSRRRKG